MEILNQLCYMSILIEIIWLFVESNVFAICGWRCLLFIISTTQTQQTSEMGQNILGHTNSKALKRKYQSSCKVLLPFFLSYNICPGSYSMTWYKWFKLSCWHILTSSLDLKWKMDVKWLLNLLLWKILQFCMKWKRPSKYLE